MTDWDNPVAASRVMWGLFEPIHSVPYFAQEPRAAFEQIGLRGYWRGYIAGRAAPLGPVGPSSVVAAFYGFAPSMIERAVPDVWSRADPKTVLEARAAGARATLRRLLGNAAPAGDVNTGPGVATGDKPGTGQGAATRGEPGAEPGNGPGAATGGEPGTGPGTGPGTALGTGLGTGLRAGLRAGFGVGLDARLDSAAELMRRAAEAADVLGRPLAAANADVPWPDDPLDVIWQAATLLREHRGDGHITALMIAGLDGCESLVWRSAVDSDRGVLQPVRGWSDEEWMSAGARLIARGWLDGNGYPTGLALIAREQIESTTDTLAAAPWRALGPADTARLASLLRPIAVAAGADLPFPNPVGVPRPTLEDA